MSAEDLSATSRAALLETLADDLGRLAVDGIGSAAIVEGEPGIGKSTLMTKLEALAVDLGVSSRVATAGEIGRSRPYGLVVDLLSAAPELVATSVLDQAIGTAPINTPFTGTSAASARFAAIESLVSIVEAAVADRPLLLVVEDLQWADTGAMAAVEAMVGAAASHPLMLIGTSRVGEADAVLDRLSQAGAARHMLAGFREAELGELLESLCGGPAGPRLVTQAARSGGNPMLLTEYVNGLLGESKLIAADGVVDVATDQMPASMQTMVSRRIGEIEHEVLDFLRPASILGRTFRVDDVAAMVQRPAAALASTIEQAVKRQVLREHDRQLQFRHDLLRESVYQAMSPGVRGAMHNEAAQVLAARSASPVIIGAHVVLGGNTSDPAAVRWLRQAAEDTANVTPEASLEFLDRALEVSRGGLDDQLPIQRARMEAFTSLGRMDEAGQVISWMLSRVPTEDRPELQARRAGVAVLTGDGAGSVAILDQALDEATADLDRARIHALAAHARMGIADYRGATESGQAAVELGVVLGDPVSHSTGLATTARIAAYSNDFDHALRVGKRAVEVADRDSTGTAHLYLPAFLYGHTALDADELEIADAMVRRGRNLAEEFTIEWSLPLYGALAAHIFYRRGDLDNAFAEAETSELTAMETDSTQALMWARAILALVAYHRGDLEEARRLSDAAMEAWATGRSPLCSDSMLVSRTLVLQEAGDAQTALEEMVGAWDVYSAFGTEICHPTLAMTLGRLARGVGDSSRVEVTAEAISVIAERSGLASDRGLAAWLHAMVSGQAKDYMIAADFFRQSPRRLDLAACLADAAVAWRQQGDAGKSLSIATEANDLFAACGASAPATKLADELVAIGGQLSVSPRPTHGWDSLTAAEQATVRLLADGLTNAQIAQDRAVSKRTIESHLRRVYLKLDMDSRVKLTVAAAQRFASD